MATIGDLVVNLSANTNKFSGGINKARQDTASFATTAGSAMTGMLGPIAKVAAGFLTVKAAVDVMSHSLSAGREAAMIANKFDAVIEASGNAAGLSASEYDELAGSIQKLTSFDDDAATNAMASLAKFGTISGDQFKRALPLAADLASVMETDLASGAQTLGKALASPDKGLAALEKSVGRFTDKQHDLIDGFLESGQLAKAQGVLMDALSAKVGGAAEKMADPFTQLGNAVDNTFEAIGANLMAFGEGFFALGVNGEINNLADGITALVPLARELGADAAAAFGDVSGAVKSITDEMKFLGANAKAVSDELQRMAGIAVGLLGKRDVGGNRIANRMQDEVAKLKEFRAAQGKKKEDHIGNEDWRHNFAQDAKEKAIAKKNRAKEIEAANTKRLAKDFGLDEMLRLGGREDKPATENAFTRQVRGGGNRLAGASEMGSQAAYSSIVQAMNSGGDRIAKSQLDTEKQILGEIKKRGIAQKTVDLTIVERFA
jgi:hypothetical protein